MQPIHSLESLESRQMLAVDSPVTDVIAKVADGTLILRGDAGDNVLVIDTQDLEKGDVRIQGNESTHINGDTLAILSGVRDIRIQLRGGNDNIAIENARLRGDVHIGAGDSADNILIRNTRIAGDLAIFSRGGNDDVNLIETTIAGKTTIGTGAGNDVFTASATTFKQMLRVEAGAGNDTVHLGDSTLENGRRIHTGPGNDLFNKRSTLDETDFRDGLNGWTGGFADYGTNMTDLRLKWGLEDLPEDLAQDGTGFYIQGMNRSDDLLMYLTRTLRNLKPNTEYQVRFELTFASNAGSGCFGVGGAPGESVYLKAGAATKKPATKTDQSGFVEVNFDKGQQANGGRDASLAGHIANGSEDCSEAAEFVTLMKKHLHAFRVKTDAKGKLHLVAATDSGYEGFTRLYYQQIKTQLIEIAK